MRKIPPVIKELCIWCFRASAILPDSVYLKIIYRIRVHKKLNLNDPKSFTEKIQYMKLTDHNPIYTCIADKYAVREFVEERIGKEYLVKLYGVYDKIEEIPYSKLPEQFVIKATHDSGGCILVDNKNKLNIKKTNKRLKRILHRNFYWKGREWCYKNIPPRIICEELLEDEIGNGLIDYKIYCFHGIPRMIGIATNRKADLRFDYFDTDFNHLNFVQSAPNSETPLVKPEHFEEMLDLATKLSKGFQQVRVDLYNIKGKIYFGEMTLYDSSGLDGYQPDEWDYKIGAWW